MTNEWRFGGEVFKITEKDTFDVGALLFVRGVSQRTGYGSASIVEFTATVSPEDYDRALRQGLQMYSIVEMVGHFETHIKASEYNLKTSIRYYADEIKIIKIK